MLMYSCTLNGPVSRPKNNGLTHLAIRKLVVTPDHCLPLPAQYHAHTTVPTILSSLFTYKQESMFISTLSYHEQLFNGINCPLPTLSVEEGT